MKSDEHRPVAQPRAGFPTTHWSVVLQVGGKASGVGELALERLVRAYYDSDRRVIKHAVVDEAWFDEPAVIVDYQRP